jgi:isopentenyl phosphate kinase
MHGARSERQVKKMKNVAPLVLKIGGSVITDRNSELAAKTEVINRLATEIQRAKVDGLIIVHGGGSFGHPTAQKYALHEGFKDESQKIGFAETHHVMTVLNGLLLDALVWHGVPAVSIAPSSCIIAEKGGIKVFEDSALRRLLEMGFIPVLYGDAVLDEALGFTVLSGDQLIAYLARRFHGRGIIVGGDTDGVYDADPKKNRGARLYQRLTLAELREIQHKLGGSTSTDVTGGMLGKIQQLIPAVEEGIPVRIVNATRANVVYKALVGEKVEGTLIEKA